MINWIREIDSSIWGVIMSILMSVLRILRDKEESKFSRIMIESLLCGAISFTIGSAVHAMGYEGWDYFIGGMVGMAGSQWVRAIAMRFVRNKVE